MKKCLLTLTLLLLTLVVVAPSLSDKDRNAFNIKLWNEYSRLKYEAEFTSFINYLGYKESRNTWTAVNTLGYFGEWQFGYKTLKYLGYDDITLSKFKTDPSIFPRELQLKVLKELIRVNEIQLIPYMEYIGLDINGTIITKAGLLAGCHLGGIGSVQIYLNSFGIVDKMDKYGTKISDYIKEFGLYSL